MSSPKIDLNPQTPSEKILSQAEDLIEKEVVDADGKIYRLKVPGPLDEFDLSAALGKDNAINVALMIQAMPLIYIESIDGEPFKKPRSFSEIRACLKRIGRNGMRVVSEAMHKFNAAEQSDQEESLFEIKK